MMMAVFSFAAIPGHGQDPVRNGKKIMITNRPEGWKFKPLDEIVLSISEPKGNTVVVWDGKAEEYFRCAAEPTVKLLAGGSLGTHTVCLMNAKGGLVDKASFEVDCRTEINDEKGYYKGVMRMLYNTMAGANNQNGTEAQTNYVDGKFYNYFVCWLRDHVHTLKGMKYFYRGDIKSAIDLYANYQRADGMIFDNIYNRFGETNYWDVRFSYGGFILPVDNGNYEMKRIPVEADVEYLFIEGLYYTWKATGDDEWMKSRLDNALKALKYATSDPYRWSEKYQLIKRGYTIDTWDFQNEEDARISAMEGKPADPMVINLGRTRFNIMHGDNTGMAAGCFYLAEMLEYAGRSAEAAKVRQQGKDILERLYKVSWNGQFFTHMVPEDPSVKRDLGVDEKSQVSLSNAYDLNRFIDHDKAVAIIKTYQRIRKEMPATSPGEFYGIYPPFPKGFGQHTMWEYVNGGVTGMVAGELAHGAFEHGFESYGVDIINRMYEFSKQFGEYLHDTYRGAIPEDPVRNFEPLNLSAYANVDVDGTKGTPGVPAWTGEGDNDFHQCPSGKQVYEKIPFVLIRPDDNGRKACIGLSGAKGYQLSVSIPVNKKAASVYFLHTLCIKSGAGTTNAGTITLRYTDNTTVVDVVDNSKIGNWWYPAKKLANDHARRAFVIQNNKATAVGAYVYGYNNPYPEKTIKAIELQAYNIESKWMIFGITLSDYPVYYTPDIISYGMPANWCAAALEYAMVEGLAGVKDKGTLYSKVLFAPRWAAAEVNKVSTTIRYGSSEGYVSYHYQRDPSAITILYTANGAQTDARILLPQSRKASSVKVNGVEVPFTAEQIESSTYAVFSLKGKGVYSIVCSLQ